MKNIPIHVSVLIFAAAAVFSITSCKSQNQESGSCGEKKCQGYVQKSPENNRYLGLTTGQTYIPIGMNICWKRGEKDMRKIMLIPMLILSAAFIFAAGGSHEDNSNHN